MAVRHRRSYQQQSMRRRAKVEYPKDGSLGLLSYLYNRTFSAKHSRCCGTQVEPVTGELVNRNVHFLKEIASDRRSRNCHQNRSVLFGQA